jgi:hypothetical protein
MMSKRFTLYGPDFLGGGISLLAVALLPLSGLLNETGLQQRTRLVAERRALVQSAAEPQGQVLRAAIPVPIPVRISRRADSPG